MGEQAEVQRIAAKIHCWGQKKANILAVDGVVAEKGSDCPFLSPPLRTSFTKYCINRIWTISMRKFARTKTIKFKLEKMCFCSAYFFIYWFKFCLQLKKFMNYRFHPIKTARFVRLYLKSILSRNLSFLSPSFPLYDIYFKREICGE